MRPQKCARDGCVLGRRRWKRSFCRSWSVVSRGSLFYLLPDKDNCNSTQVRVGRRKNLTDFLVPQDLHGTGRRRFGFSENGSACKRFRP